MLSAILHFIKGFPTMTDDVLSMISGFLSISLKKKFVPHLTCTLIKNIRHVANCYPELLATDEEVAEIFYCFQKFLKLNHLDIQYATIDTLIYLFDNVWLTEHIPVKISFRGFHLKLFEHCSAQWPPQIERDDKSNNSENVLTAIDDQSRQISVFVQLFSGIITKNYVLRKKGWFALTELCLKEKLSKGN